MDDQIESRYSGERRRWRLLFIGLFAVGVILLGLTVFFRFTNREEMLPVPLRSEETADYSSDPRFRVPVIRRKAVEGILGDQPLEAPDDLSTMISNLETPVPTVTPRPFLTLTGPPPPQPTQPLIVPSATASAISTPVGSSTPLPPSPTLIETILANPSATPDPSPSVDPSMTPIFSPSPTQIGSSPTPTQPAYPPPPTPTSSPPMPPPPTPYP